MGQQLLNEYPNGFPLRGRNGKHRTVRVSQSRYPPNARLVEGLQRRMEERRLSQSDSEEEYSNSFAHGSTSQGDEEYVSPGLRFKGIQWGVWTSGGTFGHCGSIERGGRVTYNSEIGELRVVDIYDVSPEIEDESGIIIDNTTIHELVFERNASRPRLFLTLDTIPRFWSHNSERHILHDKDKGDPSAEFDEALRRLIAALSIDWEDPTVYRLPALCLEHGIDAPYCTVYAFDLEGTNFKRDLMRLSKSMKRTIRRDAPTCIPTCNLNFSEGHAQLEELYSNHDYTVAFQMESYIRNCLLIPSEVIDLNEQIQLLEHEYGSERVVRILQNLGSQLPIRTFERLSEPLDLSGMLRDAEKQYFWERKPDPNAAWIHRLDITPAAYNMDGPEWTGTNRVLRLYPSYHDRFLKVSFTEEDLSKIQQNRDIVFEAILKGRWASAFKRGIKICGRSFYFLGFSQSSLHEHSAWFLAPFEDLHSGQIVTADSLRSHLGDFSHIRCASRLAARIGQTFTTTSHSLKLASNEVSKIEDVVQESYVFSDGVGTMSQALIERIWNATVTNENMTKPVVYQIRIGGAKGVLSLDKTLKGSQVCLRPSMIKFEAPNSNLEIANTGRILPFFLNRQMIVILETLGLESEKLITLQEQEVARLQIASHDFDEASRLCRQYGLGQAVGLQRILNTLQNEGVEAIFDMPFFRKLNASALSYALKQIKYRSRVAVNRSWKLIGVMDEFRYLKPGEVYVCLKDDEAGSVEYLEGDILVTRSPALHCGDLQKVHAIGSLDSSHPLSALYNCIVFSSQGSRPIPNQLSGGDLDGDLFDISQHPLLFPPNYEKPDSYPSVSPVDFGRQCTMDDISKFFLDFIVNDNLGQICSRHAIIADQSEDGVRSEDCVKLSRLASVAVDFPKTGIPANIRDIPYVDTRIKPDFMARQPLSERDFVPGPQSRDISPSPNYSGSRPDRTYYYKSKKVLGKMYRSLDIEKFLHTWDKNSGWNDDGPAKLWQIIEGNLQKLVPSYKAMWHEYIKEAQEMFETYMEELEMIQWYYHPTPWKNHLSESEVFLQCISMAPSVRFVRGRGKSDYLQQLRLAYAGLVDWVRSAILASVDGRYQRAAAYFYVGIHSAQKWKSREGESFAWLVVPDLFEAWKTVQKNGIDGGENGL